MRRPPPRPRIRRRWIVIGAVVLVLLISISSVVRFYTDLLWFGELGFTTVFWKVFTTRVGVGVVGGAVAGLVLLVNLEVARRVAPRYRFVTPGGDIAEQYRSVFRPYARLANIGAAAVVAFFTGLSTSAAWERFLLWRNARPFGVRAPEPFGSDISFYVFNIPFQRTIISWLFGILVVSLLFSVLAHLLNGSIQPEQNRVQVATVVRVHVSVLLGLVALVKAWAYRLDQFDLVYSPRGTVTGASYTDVHAQLPALRLLVIIAVVAALIFFANVVRFRGWLLPGAAVVLWAFVSIVAGAIIPAFVQRFTVTPNEARREAPFIERNIEATRKGFGLDRIKTREFGARETLTPETVDENQGTIANVRLWDPTVLIPTFQRLQAIRTYYDFHDVDVDRYTIDGRLTQVMLSGREVDSTRLPSGAQNWLNTRLVYTHGYGAVGVPANSVTREGLPSFLLRDLPPEGAAAVVPARPGLYFGERVTGYSVVNTKQAEIDYPSGEQDVVETRYSGDGGIELSSLLRRLAFAVRFGDTDLLISSLITPESRVMMRRDILSRAQEVAPFLKYDGDPYLVVADGKFYWMMDAYTFTDRFPYSERVNLGEVATRGGLTGSVNYMRNSVKVVIDAFEGTATFYVVEPSDPLAATYQATFPALFKPIDGMPASLRAHLRYPEDLFKIQAAQYRVYHILDSQRFYHKEDAWDLPQDPVHSSAASPISMEPYYVVMKLPEEDQEEFLLMLPFTPRGRPNLNGWVAARMDPGRYGELIGFTFPRGTTIQGPENIAGRIEQDATISQQFSLWEGAGSRVVRGNLFVIPIGSSLIYVQPIYLEAQEAARALPELRRVIVVVGDRIGFEPTLEASLEAAMTGAEPSLEEGEAPERPREPERPSGDVGDLLGQAAQHFANAEEALRRGDLATYQRENEAARRAVEQAREQRAA